jgi:hypothetical protein
MTMILDGSAGATFPNGTNPQAAPSKVLQVVQNSYSTQTSTSGQTYVDTGLNATITPIFSTSKILVMVNHATNYKDAANTGNDIKFNLCRNGSQIVVLGTSVGYTGTTVALYFSFSAQYLDSPATTSAITYKTQFGNTDSTGGTVYVQASGDRATITLMEIAA